MARLGAFCFPGTGHLNPMTALAHSLQKRGHQVILFGIADAEARVRAAGIEFCQIGASDFPIGALHKLDTHLSRLNGVAAFRFTLKRVRDSARMVYRDGPDAVRAARIDALLVDEAEFAGSIADYLGLPRISVALIPPMTNDDRFPPFWFGWPAGQDWLSRLRNRLGINLLLWIARSIFNEGNEQRKAWGLEPYKHPSEAISTIARVTQLPAALEFDVGERQAAQVHYTGPFVEPTQRPPIEFPWERLDGRPIIYASLGTLQNGSEYIYKAIADACAPLDAQLVLSLGGGLDPEGLGELAGDPVLVRFAPQLEILKRAALVIAHGGINTVLESLSEGVPLVLVPLANDQPGMASRVRARGAGVVVPRRKLSAARLRKAVLHVLNEPQYREAACGLQKAISQQNGPELAADLIEQALKIGSAQAIGR